MGKDINQKIDLLSFNEIHEEIASMSKPETVTVTFKTKWLWVVVGVLLSALTVAPVIASAYPASGTTSGNSSSPVSSGATPNCTNPCTIVIQNSQFGQTQPIIVSAGTKVTWANKDSTEHTVTSDTGLFGSSILSPGQTFSYTFSNAGTFNYHCLIHPMTGTIQVV
jgi:plastocyanin